MYFYARSVVKSQNTVKPNPLCRLPVTSDTSRDVPFSPNSITPTSPKLPWTGSFGEVGVMEFGLKETSRLVADVTGSRHSGLGFTVFWLFTTEYWSNSPYAFNTYFADRRFCRWAELTYSQKLTEIENEHSYDMYFIPVDFICSFVQACREGPAMR